MMNNRTTTEQATVQVGKYYLALGVLGFGKTIKEKTTIRVKVIRVAGPLDIIVQTASLKNAGSIFPVSLNQLSPCL